MWRAGGSVPCPRGAPMQTVTCACGRQLKGFPGATVRCLMCGKTTPVPADSALPAVAQAKPAPQPAAATAPAVGRLEPAVAAPARTVTAASLEGSHRNDPVHAVAFAPNGLVLAGGGEFESVVLWDRETGQEIQRLTGNGGATYSVAFSPDGTRFASGGRPSELGEAFVFSDPRSGK